MATFLALAVASLGVVLNGWSHAGHEDGDFERRTWARYLGVPIAVLGALAAFVLAVVQ